VYILVGLGSLKYETLFSFQTHLLTEQVGLNRLFQGYLPREFVTPSMLKDVLSTIHNKLIHSYSRFQLVYPDIQHYYHIKDVVFCVKDEHLYIMVKFPISRVAAKMKYVFRAYRHSLQFKRYLFSYYAWQTIFSRTFN
jgi:hypothetical protein